MVNLCGKPVESKRRFVDPKIKYFILSKFVSISILDAIGTFIRNLTHLELLYPHIYSISNSNNFKKSLIFILFNIPRNTSHKNVLLSRLSSFVATYF